MNTKRLFTLAIAAFTLLSSCRKEQETDSVLLPVEEPVEISAVMPVTRTELGEKNDNVYPNYWSSGDAISVNGTASSPLAEVPAGTTKATFVLSGVSAPYKAAYPASAVSAYSAGSATLTIPSEQTYKAGSYDPAAFVMLGRSDAARIEFSAAVCVFKLTPKGSGSGRISSVTLRGLGSGSALSGQFSTDFASLASTSASKDYVTVNCEGGAALGEPFYIVFAPSDFSAGGFRVVITDTGGGSMTRTAVPSKAYEAGKLYAAEIDYEPVKGLAASFGSASSSTLSFTWTAGVSVADDISRPYSIALYRDASCTDEVAAFDIPENEACWNSRQPRFVFGALESDTDYWFRAKDSSTGAQSVPVKGRTLPFTVVTMPESISAPGVVLAEDFGELAWDSDYIDQAAGFRPSDRSGLSNREVSYYTRAGQASEITWAGSADAIASSRLASWAASAKAYLHPGFVKLGTASAAGWVLTPQFTVPEGKVATVKVTVTGARYSGANDNWAVAVLSPEQAVVTGSTASVTWPAKAGNAAYDPEAYQTVPFTSNTSWGTQSVSGLFVRAGDRIVFGTEQGSESTKGRSLVSDITVEVLSISDEGSVAASSVHGYVRCDGSPLEGVVVSDGFIVTATDASGHYSMDSEKRNGYVFVSLPSGYTAATDGVLPQLYKRTTAPSGVSEEISFDLLRDDGQDNHTMLVFGDIHLAARTNDQSQFAIFTSEINSYRSSHPAEKVYALTLGDMSWDVHWYVNNFDLAGYLTLANAMKGMPIFHTIGNHDHDMNATGDWDTVLAYHRIIAPNWYSFNIGKVHYMVIDNIVCTNATASTTNGNYRTYNEAVSEEILDWIGKDLAYVDKSTPIVVTMHAPTWTENGGVNLDNTDALAACFNGYSNVRFISGHSHKIRVVFKNNIKEINSGSVCATWWWTGYYNRTLNISTDGSPGGYRVISVRGKEMESYYKGTGRPENYQFRTYDRNCIAITAASLGITTYADAFETYLKSYGNFGAANDKNYVLINVWDYDTNWKVEASEDNVNFKTCNRLASFDPLFLLAYTAYRFKSTSTPSFNPSSSRHFFRYTASSPTSTVYIRVTDDEGRVYTETMTRPKEFSIKTYK